METITEDWVIYESEEWVTRFRKREIQDAWETYYQMILGIRERNPSQAEEFPDLLQCKAVC
jgi:hypothetical protein